MSTFLVVISFLAVALALSILAVMAVIYSKAKAYRQQLADEISADTLDQERREAGDALAARFQPSLK